MLELEERFLRKKRDPGRDEVGVYRKAFKAYAKQRHIREAGAGGGVATALLTYALESGRIDAAVVTGFNEQKPYLAEGSMRRMPGPL